MPSHSFLLDDRCDDAFRFTLELASERIEAGIERGGFAGVERERSLLQVQAQRVGLIEGPGGYRRGR